MLVDTFGTGTIEAKQLEDLVRANFSLTPKGIIETLQLRRPIFKQTAAYGHFGRTGDDFSWEKTDKVEALKAGAAKGGQSISKPAEVAAGKTEPVGAKELAAENSRVGACAARVLW